MIKVLKAKVVHRGTLLVALAAMMSGCAAQPIGAGPRHFSATPYNAFASEGPRLFIRLEVTW